MRVQIDGLKSATNATKYVWSNDYEGESFYTKSKTKMDFTKNGSVMLEETWTNSGGAIYGM